MNGSLTKEETIEGNVLIAKFEGWKIEYGDSEQFPNWYRIRVINPKGKQMANLPSATQSVKDQIEHLWIYYASYNWGYWGNFHFSWDRLMTIVEKVEKLGFNVHITTNYISISCGRSIVQLFNTDKDKKIMVYKGIVQFVKWFNENGTENN